MVRIFKEIVKRNKKIYGILCESYDKWISPIKNGHLLYYIQYCKSIRRKEISDLNYYGLNNVKPILWRTWRIGRGRDGAHRRYYLGHFQDKQCFIKIGYKDETVKNELDVLNKQIVPIPFSPQLLIGSMRFSDETVMIAVEYIEGLSEFKLPSSKKDFSKMCGEFITILDELKTRGIVHADIHKGNLMIKNNNLYLLDYGISMVLNDGNTIDYNSRPGTFYVQRDGIRTYDDAYSFVETIVSLDASDEFKNMEEFENIKNKVGDFFFQVRIK